MPELFGRGLSWAAALVCALIDQGLVARQPRYLVLGPNGMEAGGSTGAAAIR